MRELKLLQNHELNKVKWDTCVEGSVNAKIYAFSWYLDIVASAWSGLVYGDDELVFPIVHKRMFCLQKVNTDS